MDKNFLDQDGYITTVITIEDLTLSYAYGYSVSMYVKKIMSNVMACVRYCTTKPSEKTSGRSL
jgi:hypothetical protein